MSSVGDTSTLAPAPRPVDAMVRTPTEDSGFCCIFAPTTRLAASCWLSCRVGVKSPFLMNSLVSRHIMVDSRGMVAGARALVARAAAAFWSAGRSLWGPRRAAPARSWHSSAALRWRGRRRSTARARAIVGLGEISARLLPAPAPRNSCVYAGHETDNSQRPHKRGDHVPRNGQILRRESARAARHPPDAQTARNLARYSHSTTPRHRSHSAVAAHQWPTRPAAATPRRPRSHRCNTSRAPRNC